MAKKQLNLDGVDVSVFKEKKLNLDGVDTVGI